MHRALVRWRRLPAMEQMQEVRADRIVVGFDVDPAAVVGVVVPVEQHRSKRGHQPVGDIARAGLIVIMGLRQDAAERGDAASEDIHRMRRGGQQFQRLQHRERQAAQRLQLGLVVSELRQRGQAAVNQKIRDLLELAGFGDIENVVAAIMQVVSGAADRAQRGVAGDHA